MNKGIGIALLVVGIALIVYGMQASDSVSSGVSRAFTGAPTNRTVAFLVGGAASAIIGLFMTIRSRRA
jgi:Na+/phosphate symporter